MRSAYCVGVLLFLLACRQPVPVPIETAAVASVVTETAVSPTSTPTAAPTSSTASPSPTPLPSTTTPLPPSPTILPPSATPTATPDLYSSLTIDALAARRYGGGLLDIVETLDALTEDEPFTRYLITYPSDGLTIYGYMAVPKEGAKFPVAIVLHGYIDPADYETIAYTRRYVDSLAEAGYFVIHPNFRNYPPSDSGTNPYRIGYAIDVLNLIAIIREQSQDSVGYLRRADANDINLWGHSMGGGVALRVITVNNEEYLRTAVLYASMSGNEAWNYERIQVWSGGANGPFELAAPPEMLQAISPIYHSERINAAISIHHSEADEIVPIAWSNDLCQRLETLQHPVECFTYYAIPHTFRGAGDELFMERVVRFYQQH